MSLFRRILSFLVPYVAIDTLYRRVLMPHHIGNGTPVLRRDQWHSFHAHGQNFNYFRASIHDRRKRNLITLPGNMENVSSQLEDPNKLGQFNKTHNLYGMDYRYTESNAVVGYRFSDQSVRQHVEDIKAFIEHLHQQGIPYNEMDIHAESFGSQAAIWAVYELIQASHALPLPLADNDNPEKITLISRNGFADFSDYHPLLNQKNVIEGMREAGLTPPINLVEMALAIPNLFIISTDDDLIVPDRVGLRAQVEKADTESHLLATTFRTRANIATYQRSGLLRGPHNCQLSEATLPGINMCRDAVEEKSMDQVELAIFTKNYEQLELYAAQLISNVETLLETLEDGPDRNACLPEDSLDPVVLLARLRDKAFIKRNAHLNIALIRDQCYSLIKLQNLADKLQGNPYTYPISHEALTIAEVNYPIKPNFSLRVFINPWIQGVVLTPIILFAGIGKLFGLLGDALCSGILRQSEWGKAFNKFCDTVGAAIGLVIGGLIALTVAIPLLYLKTLIENGVEAIAGAIKNRKQNDYEELFEGSADRNHSPAIVRPLPLSDRYQGDTPSPSSVTASDRDARTSSRRHTDRFFGDGISGDAQTDTSQARAGNTPNQNRI